MQVKELIELLQGCEPENLVVMSSDSEGNTFSPLSSIAMVNYIPENTYSGYLVDDEDIDEEEKKFIKNAVVLFPIN